MCRMTVPPHVGQDLWNPNLYLFVADIANPDLFVVPGFISTSTAVMMSSTIHPASPYDWLAQKTVIEAQLLGAEGSTTDSSTTCILCRLESSSRLWWVHPAANRNKLSNNIQGGGEINHQLCCTCLEHKPTRHQ